MSELNPVVSFQDHIDAITVDFPINAITTIESDDSTIAVIDFECANQRWISLICEDSSDEITQLNIVGDKAIAALAAMLDR